MANSSKKLEVQEVIGFYHPRPRIADYTGEVVHPVTGEVSRPVSMTKQEFVAECDINNIIREYTMTGQISHISARAQQGAFLDLPGPLDFQESVHVVMRAEAAFAQLPSQVRERFENNPQGFLDFISNDANRSEVEKLGLLKKPLEPPQVAVVSMPAAAVPGPAGPAAAPVPAPPVPTAVVGPPKA